MNNNRIWVGGSLALAAIVLLTGWFVGVSPMLAMAAKTESDRAMVLTQNDALGITLASLKERYTKLGGLRAELADLRGPLPGDADMPAFLGQLDRLAASSGAKVTSIAVSDGLPFIPAIPEQIVAVEQAPAEAPVGGVQPTVADVSTPAVIDVAAIAGAELVTPESFVSIPVGITASGSLEQVTAFMKGLQTGKRLFLVTKFSMMVEPASGLYSLSIDGFAYTLVNTFGPLGTGVGTSVDATTATVN